jgi:hypothetical protein
VLVMHPRHAGLMSGEEARQLIRRHQKVDGGNDEQDDAEQGQDKLHGGFLLDKMEGRLTLPAAACRPVYRLPAAPRKWSDRARSFRHFELERPCGEASMLVGTMLDRVRRQPKMISVIEADILIYNHGAPDFRGLL